MCGGCATGVQCTLWVGSECAKGVQCVLGVHSGRVQCVRNGCAQGMQCAVSVQWVCTGNAVYKMGVQ